MTLRERIASCLGWPLSDVNTMSLPALHSMVREKDPDLYSAISEVRKDDRHMTSRVLSWKRGKPVLEQDV